MGIYPSQSTVSSRRSSINLRNISFLISFLLLFASTTGSFWFLAQTNIERVNNFYIALTELACINNFLETWRNVPNKIQLVGKMEKFVKKSEFIARWQPKLLVSLTRFLFLLIEPENADLKIKYTELDEKLTKISHIIQFVMVKLTIPSVMLPSIIPTFINYFYLELGKESYALTYPLMYEHSIWFATLFLVRLNFFLFAGSHSIGKHRWAMWSHRVHSLGQWLPLPSALPQSSHLALHFVNSSFSSAGKLQMMCMPIINSPRKPPQIHWNWKNDFVPWCRATAMSKS